MPKKTQALGQLLFGSQNSFALLTNREPAEGQLAHADVMPWQVSIPFFQDHEVSKQTTLAEKPL